MSSERRIVREATPAVFPQLARLVWPFTKGFLGEVEPCSALRSFVDARTGSRTPVEILLETDDLSAPLAPFTVDGEQTDGTAQARFVHLVTDWSVDFRPRIEEPFYHPQPGETHDAQQLHEALKTTLREASEAADRALVTGDRRQLERMVRAAGQLEYLRMEARC